MPKCPNCGQATARTEDWACQWCGYPLTSSDFKKINKTYRQLQAERLPIAEPVTTAEPELRPVVEPEPEVTTADNHEPEPTPEPEPEPTPTPEPEPAVVPAEKQASEPVTEPEAVLDIMELPFEELVAAYETEGTAADARFSSKILQITGTINRIEVREELNIYYISLGSDQDNVLVYLRCVFDEKHGDQLNQLTSGQRVTVRGKYDGSIIDMRISDCVLVN